MYIHTYMFGSQVHGEYLAGCFFCRYLLLGLWLVIVQTYLAEHSSHSPVLNNGLA